MKLQQAPKIVQQQGETRQIQEREVVGEVIRQETIERHVQPVITEVRQQKVIQEVLHPVVRTVHEAPIIREVTSTVAPTVIQSTGFQQQGFVQQQPMQTGFVQQSAYTEKQGLGQKLTNVLHHNQTTTTQQPMQSGFVQQQPLLAEKQSLGQKISNVLHHNQTTTTQQPLEQGLVNPLDNNLNRGTGFQSNNALMPNQLGGGNLSTTTTTNNWGTPSSITTNTSGNAGSNLIQHEQKVINREHGLLDNAERQNLSQHERVVESVVQNPGAIQQNLQGRKL